MSKTPVSRKEHISVYTTLKGLTKKHPVEVNHVDSVCIFCCPVAIPVL